MNFSDVLKMLKDGDRVAREGWNGKDMYLYLVRTKLPFPLLSENKNWDSTTFEKSRFIVMKTADSKLIPWLASQTDLLAEDWLLVE